MNKEYDAIIIGGGVAGYYSAKTLAKAGYSVALIEKDVLGGTAIRWGALPVKKVLDAYKKYEHIESHLVKEMLVSNWDSDLEKLNKKIVTNLFDLAVDIYYGNGEFINSKQYKLNDEILESKYYIIATGTQSDDINQVVIDGEYIISHKEVIDLNNISKKVIILGGNVEGVELAFLYGEMGVDTTIIEKQETLLFQNDVDLVEPIEKRLKSLGVRIIKGVGVKKAEVLEKNVKVTLEDGKIMCSDQVVSTIKRKPNFPKGIENTKIKTDENRVLVNNNLMTDETNIFAIGDVNGILGMAHVAIQQAIEVSEYIINEKSVNTNYEILPRAVFTLPEMAGVGIQEWELKESNIQYKVGKCLFQDTWRGWSKNEEGFVKIILDKDNVILGIWMVGRNVSEYIGLLGFIVKEKKTVDYILSNLIINPSLTEAILEAAIDGKAKEIK